MGSLFFICTVMNGKSIKDWRQEDRPREKMLERGASALTDAELLAILLRTGTGDKSAVDIARELLAAAGDSMRNLAAYSPDRILSIQGIGPSKAVTLLAAFEAGRRSMSSDRDCDRVIANVRDVVEYMNPVLAHLDHEECWVIFLNRKNRIICRERLSVGGVSATVIDVKMVVRRAVEKLASAIILVHNHPGGSPKPGRSDISNTEALRKAVSTLDIKLLDHVILAGRRYYSFGEANNGN